MGSDLTDIWDAYSCAESYLAWNTYDRVFNTLIQPNWIKETGKF